MFGLLLCAGVVATSCSDDPDPIMDEIPYERILTPMNFEAEVVASVGTDIKFTWSAMEGAEGYILQLFEGVGEEALAPDYDQATPVKEYDVPADGIPFVATGLEVDVTYWARLQAYSTTIGDSKWAELQESVSTSAVRKGLNPEVTERTTSSVAIKWDDAEDKADLTSIRIEKVTPAEGDEAVLYTLTDEEKEAAAATLSELEACTNYRFTLLFGKSGKRGVVTAWTRPSTEGLNEVNTADGLFAALNGATGDVKLLVKYNEAGYNMEGLIPDLGKGLTIDCNLTLVGETTEEGKKPAIYNMQFTMGAASTYIHLEDLVLDGTNKCGTMMQNDAASLTAMEVVNCEICNYQKGIYTVASGGTSNANKLLYSGVYAHDINATGSQGGDFIDLRAGMTDAVEIVNSTFYACARTFFRASDNAKLGTATIANCTFNYVTSTVSSSNNAGIFHVRKTTETTGLFMNNNVFLNEYNDAEDATGWVRIARNSTDSYAPKCEGNIYYNVGPAWFVSGAHLVGTETAFSEADAMVGGMVLENDPCVNSAAGKLYLTDPVVAANKAGDPRWWDAVEPVVVRATSLETVTEPKVWDFTEKTIFQSETIETNTIIDNIKIYGPAELVMSKGITFTEAGVMDSKPQSGALHFKAEGYGAVVVTTEDAGYNGSIQVVAGEDRYTVQADGKPHKVLFGDLVGANDIYVLAGSKVTITSVEWTQDLTPDATALPLATPVVLLDFGSLDVGTEQAVVASWKEVENAATYDVTFNNVTVSQTETTFTLDAATVAALPVGEYELTVVAKPVETSSKWAASEVGKTTLKIKALPVGGVVTWKWNFSEIFTGGVDPLVAADEKSVYLLNSDGTKTDVGVEGATAAEALYMMGNGKAIKVKAYENTADSKTYYTINYGGGDAFMFINVPQDGVLKVTATQGKSVADNSDCQLGVYVGGPHKDKYGFPAGTLVGEKVQLVGYDKAAPKNNALTYEFPITGITEPTMVAITKPGGSTSPEIYDIEFTYETAPVVETVWDFATIFTAKVDPLVATDETSIYKLNDDGSKTDVGAEGATATETLYMAGNKKKIKVNGYDNTAESMTYYGINYGGGDAFMFINVDKPGTLTVVAAQAKTAADNQTCDLAVYVGGPHKDLSGYTAGTIVGEKEALPPYDLAAPANGAQAFEFEITDVTEKTMVAITKPSGSTSPDIYKVVWSPAN